MSIFQLWDKVLRLKRVKCSQGFDADMPFDAMAMGVDVQDEDLGPNVLPKVNPFDHLLNNVVVVTGRMDFIKGFKFDLNLPLSQYFNFSHSWSIPNSGTQNDKAPSNSLISMNINKPTYTFTTQYVGDVKNPRQHPGIVMLGKVDSQSKVDAIFLRKITNNIFMKFTTNFASSNVENQNTLTAQCDIEGKNSMTSIRLLHSQGYGNQFTINYMQRVHKNLLLGFDYTNVLGQQSRFSYGVKGFLSKHTVYAQYIATQQQFNLAYMIPIRKGTWFISHWRYDYPFNKSTTILGFRQKYQKSEIVATINSRGKIATILSLKQPSYGLKLCALVDYLRDKYTFGYGITIGNQG